MESEIVPLADEGPKSLSSQNCVKLSAHRRRANGVRNCSTCRRRANGGGSYLCRRLHASIGPRSVSRELHTISDSVLASPSSEANHILDKYR